ncbi:exonuclease domain-containing protein [Pontiella agarivorans]|uniref:Exonuclease domain-containing protein n=1 Tax=Pontiella agarivorans TaxID=3038953 RepID=A0ABU5MZK7_9BACT|nr:exonuclease domain-containing protein [Pontiella agarivorans]MDZ8119648.1 exonuclease domain-containing protein [Pontiella agarivorans]
MSENVVKKTSAYVWFDAEFTSLNLESARLLQVAAIVTDTELNRLHPESADLNLCIKLPDGESVSEWVEENLPGLVKQCRSAEAVTLEEADRQLASMLDQYAGTPYEAISGRPVLAGNSVHNDWVLMRRFLPEFGSRLHYRLLDVSTLKIQWTDIRGGAAFDKDSVALLDQYFPAGGINTANAHDALFDIKASIAELAYYRANLFAH